MAPSIPKSTPSRIPNYPPNGYNCSGTKLDIIKAYFPNSYKVFLELIAKIKEQ